MTPIEKLELLYDSQPTKRTLEEDMGLCVRYGYVIATPEYILMGKAISTDASDELIEDPGYAFPKALQNAWFIYAYTGSCQHFLSFMPYYLPFVAWRRRRAKLRWYPVDLIRARCKSLTPFLTPS